MNNTLPSAKRLVRIEDMDSIPLELHPSETSVSIVCLVQGVEKQAFFINKTRTRITDHLHRQQRRKQRATCQVKKWMYENTAFERLNPHE